MKLGYIYSIVASFFIASVAEAITVTLDPISDGTLYTCDGCNVVSDGAYVVTAGYVQGAVKFSSSQIPYTIESAFLSLNPYGLPLWGPTVDVYGYGTAIGYLDVSDANAGTFLGVLSLPDDLGYGQDVFFDVTQFVTSTDSPYLAFNLRSNGVNVFSSLEYNYGHPSQLILAAVPIPPALFLFAPAFFALVFFRSKKR